MRRRLAAVFGSVRVRITLIATVALGLALVGVAVLVVRGVRGSLEDQVRAEGVGAVHAVKQRLAAGALPEEATAPAPGGGGIAVQLIAPNGEVLAGAPGPALVPFGGNATRGTTVEVPTATTGDRVLVYAQAPGPGGPFTIAASGSLDQVRRSIDTLEDALYVAVPALIALVGLGVWLLVGRALRPVEAIRREVDEISHGTLHRRVPVPPTHDEVARLARTMNGMLARVESSATLQREFVSDASHELRSPVAAIRTTAEVALAQPERADWPVVVGDLLAADLRMERIVQELLDLARASDADLHPEPFRLDEVVAEAAAAHPGAETGVWPAVEVAGRREQLVLALHNLLDNAHHHASSRVAIDLHVVDGHAVVHVDDDGPGIPVEQRERVFERFARVDEARDRGHGGVGLGLAIVRAVTTRHGGDVAVGDAPLGGARVTLRLPVIDDGV